MFKAKWPYLANGERYDLGYYINH